MAEGMVAFDSGNNNPSKPVECNSDGELLVDISAGSTIIAELDSGPPRTASGTATVTETLVVLDETMSLILMNNDSANDLLYRFNLTDDQLTLESGALIGDNMKTTSIYVESASTTTYQIQYQEQV